MEVNIHSILTFVMMKTLVDKHVWKLLKYQAEHFLSGTSEGDQIYTVKAKILGVMPAMQFSSPLKLR